MQRHSDGTPIMPGKKMGECYNCYAEIFEGNDYIVAEIPDREGFKEVTLCDDPKCLEQVNANMETVEYWTMPTVEQMKIDKKLHEAGL